MHPHTPTQGYIHLYTGNGKGKTTAAIGLSVRAAGAGKRVFIGQFVKGMPYAELDALKALASHITIRQYGRDCFINNAPTPPDIEAAQKGLAEMTAIVCSGAYDVVVLDEICIALYYRLFSLEAVLHIIDSKPAATELVLTGRYAPRELVDRAHLVTEMHDIKHYYRQGVETRKGIEF